MTLDVTGHYHPPRAVRFSTDPLRAPLCRGGITVQANDQVRITVWSDYVCPFCYLEEPVLERVREEYGDQVEGLESLRAPARSPFLLWTPMENTCTPPGSVLSTQWPGNGE